MKTHPPCSLLLFIPLITPTPSPASDAVLGPETKVYEERRKIATKKGQQNLGRSKSMARASQGFKEEDVTSHLHTAAARQAYIGNHPPHATNLKAD